MSYARDLYESQFVYEPTPTGVRRRYSATETPEDRPTDAPSRSELEAER